MAKELMEIGGFITEGAEIVNHDNSLSGNGTVDSPLGLNETVLYSNANPDSIITETALQLNESYLNFEKIKIYLKASAGSTANANYIVEAMVFQNDTTEISSLPVVNAIGTVMFDPNCFIFKTDTTTTCTVKTNGVRINLASNGTISTTGNRGVKVYKIVGINRLSASN
jgi:hypothetical protein